MQRLARLVITVLSMVAIAGVARADMIVNGTTVVTGVPPMSTGMAGVAVVGGNVNITNTYPVAVTIQVKDASGTVLGEVGILAGSRFNGPHGLGVGVDTLCGKEASASTFEEIGFLEIDPALDLAAASPRPDRAWGSASAAEPLGAARRQEESLA
jgi:hypothetical protein